MAGPKPLRIGVFVPKSVQLLDLSPVDLFAMLDPFYLEACRLPAPLVAMGIASTIHYIAASSLQSHVELTANAILKVTKTVLDEEVQPGMLDIILVPGASPSDLFEEEVYEFVRGHVAWKGLDGKQVDVLSVCTGCFVLAYAGVLKGKKSSGPRALVPTLQKKFPETKWVDDRRWVIDGNIWSSGKPQLCARRIIDVTWPRRL